MQEHKTKRTALMYLASTRNLSDEMLTVVKKILKVYNLDVNLQDADGNTCLHIAVQCNNKSFFREVLGAAALRPPVNLNLKNKQDESVLWLGLLEAESSDDFDDEAASFPSLLIAKGSDVNATAEATSGDSLLHLCARRALERAAIFLVNKQAKTSLLNSECETVLHVACENGLEKLVAVLLDKGADPNVQTSKATNSQTPMHKAILNNHENILNLFIEFKSNCLIILTLIKRNVYYLKTYNYNYL